MMVVMYLTTRNFLLYLLSVAFLIVVITATVVHQPSSANTATEVADQSAGEEVVYAGTVSTSHDVDHGSQVARLRQKIAELQVGTLASISEANEVPLVVAIEEEEGLLPTEINTPRQLQLCAGYALAQVSWPSQGVQLAVVEGVRLVFTEVLATVPPEAASSSEITLPSRDVLLQLPLLTFPGETTNCLTNDIVGVALDGSLMRNAETRLYGIFGADTLLGYALDGFPIYGTDDKKNDSCGGRLVDGEYRYTLAVERETLINCFAGSPTTW